MLKYVVVTAARNEASYIKSTIQSMTAQRILPLVWIIVDDGSTDATAEIVARAASGRDWIRLVRRQKPTGVEIGKQEALYEGIQGLAGLEYDVLAMVDADLRFGPTFFASLLARFDRSPQLGIAGGRVYDMIGGQLRQLRRCTELTFGAIKCWRRDCLEMIGGIDRQADLESLDCYRAMMNGWQARTFEEEALRITHLRSAESSKKRQKGYRERYLSRGRGLYLMGGHPLWMLAAALYHLLPPSRMIACPCLVFGYFMTWARGERRRVDPLTMQFIRITQLRTLARFCAMPRFSSVAIALPDLPSQPLK